MIKILFHQKVRSEQNYDKNLIVNWNLPNLQPHFRSEWVDLKSVPFLTIWLSDGPFSLFFFFKNLFLSFWIPFARAKFKSGASFSELTNQRGAWVTFRRLFAFRRLDRPSAISFMLSRLVCEPLLGERKSGRYSPVPEREKNFKKLEKKKSAKNRKNFTLFRPIPCWEYLSIFFD